MYFFTSVLHMQHNMSFTDFVLACMLVFVLFYVSKHVCFLLLVTWEESLNLLDDGLVTGVSFSPTRLTPISDKLL